MITSLPMYLAHPAGSAAFWHYLAHCLRQAGMPNLPLTLDIPTNADLTAHWLRPDLLFSQTCGYPIVDELENRVQVIGALRYTAPGCDGSAPRSLGGRRDVPDAKQPSVSFNRA